MDTHSKVPASLDAVRAVVANRTAVKLVWPHAETAPGRKPLLLDAFTASAIIACHDAMGAEAREKLARMVAGSKITFVRVANFCLSKVR